MVTYLCIKISSAEEGGRISFYKGYSMPRQNKLMGNQNYKRGEVYLGGLQFGK